MNYLENFWPRRIRNNKTYIPDIFVTDCTWFDLTFPYFTVPETLYSMFHLQPKLRPQTSAAYDPATTTMAQMDPVDKVSLSFTRDDAGAYQYACQILFNKDPIMHCSFYSVLEYNGLKNDILCIREIPVDMLYDLVFIDPATNVTSLINNCDVEILCAWKEYLRYHSWKKHPIKNADDVLQIDPAEFAAYLAQYDDFQHGRLPGTTPASKFMINELISYSFCDPSPVLITDSVTTPSTAVQDFSIAVHPTPTLPTLSTCMSTSSVLEDVHPPGDGELDNIDSPVVPILANNVNMCDCTTYETNTQESLHWSFDLRGENIDVPTVESETDLSIDDKTELIVFDILEDISGDGNPNENTLLLPLSDIQTITPINNAQISFDSTSNQTTMTSETNVKFGICTKASICVI